MKEIVFILSSLNDSHFRKRVIEFIEHGYQVKVYGFKRVNQPLPENMGFDYTVLGEIANRNFTSRLGQFRKAIKNIAKECSGKLCFYSSLDVALFAKMYIKSPYLYEVCDLTELVISNSFIRNGLASINKYIIKKSLDTIITSEGFAEYFSDIPQEKFSLIPNKVDPECPEVLPKTELKKDSVFKIGFVGVIRFETTYNFVKVFSESKTKAELHLYGIYSDGDVYSDKIKELVKDSDRIFFHGRFNNPDDLPKIYSQIDLLLCAYPPTRGVIYAEPNKLYEAMYFRCPIIVNNHTFLGRKVSFLNIGYVIDGMDAQNIAEFIDHISYEDYVQKVQACHAILQVSCLNINEEYFNKLKIYAKHSR